MSQITAFNPTDAALNTNNVNRFSEMTSEDFIRIIFTELANQDPLEPNDTGALLDQLNSIRSIESDMRVVEKFESLIKVSQLASAGNLLGMLVDGLTQNNDLAEGYVISVVRRNDEVLLELDSGQILPFENIQTVVDPSIFETTGDTGNDTAT